MFFLTNYYLEAFGYLGTILVIISMTMSNITKLRLFNISGAIISAIYSIIISAWPLVLLNVVLTIIHLYHLTKEYIKRKNNPKKDS